MLVVLIASMRMCAEAGGALGPTEPMHNWIMDGN